MRHHLRVLRVPSIVAGVVTALLLGLTTTAEATGGASLTGSVWQDLDRDGQRDAGEAPFAGIGVTLHAADGRFLTGVAADDEGRFGFAGLADGGYLVAIADQDVVGLREGWVPTTTGSLEFERPVIVAGATATDIGIRPIVRSRTLGAPISSVRSASGTLVESYNDAVSAQEVLTRLESGGLRGGEAAATEVRFDFQSGASCATRVAGAPGTYSGFSADVWVDWLSWITDGDRVLFHEYGHAFAGYHDHVVQQDGTYRGYLAARGLTGDPRLGTSHGWDPAEMIAEDYRLLFGTPSAQAYPQENAAIAPAAEVAGLRDYLRSNFTTPPGGSTPPTPPPPTPSTTPVAVTDVAMNPQALSTSGTGAFTLSAGASVDVLVLDAGGAVVRRLAEGAPLGPGSAAYGWDRRTDAGRKARAGQYTFVVRATGADGRTVSGSSAFSVVDPTKTGGRSR